MGFCNVEVEPSPKVQLQVVAAPVDRSEKLTEVPVELLEKTETGAAQVTVIGLQMVLVPQPFVDCKQTV